MTLRAFATLALVVSALAIPTSTNAQGAPTNGLIAHWKFEQAFGATNVVDSIGSFHGTVSTNGATINSNGISGNAMEFVRTNGGHIDFGDVLGLTNGNFTFNLWMKSVAGDTTDDTVFIHKHFVGFRNGYFVGMNTTANLLTGNKAYMFIGDPVQTPITLTEMPVSTTDVNDGRWHMITAVHQQGGEKKIYVDGRLEDRDPFQTWTPVTNNFVVGGWKDGTNFHGGYNGLLDEIRVYDRPLLDHEISALYQPFAVKSSIISTKAGGGTSLGDGGHGLQAQLAGPRGMARAGDGAIFIADQLNNRIRRIDPNTGVITTIAGVGTAGFSGDNGPAVAAELDGPRDIALFANFLYVTDANNHRIRRVDLFSGLITTIAGNGTNNTTGDNGPSISAEINLPAGIAVDSIGRLYFSEFGGHVVRRIDLNGTVVRISGTGTPGGSGDGGQATSAQLNQPSGIAFDRAGNVFIAEFGGNRIRRIDAQSGIITTVAGLPSGGSGGAGGTATATTLAGPESLVFGPDGYLYFTEFNNHQVRVLDPVSGGVFPFAGTGIAGLIDGCPSGVCRFNNPSGILFDGQDQLLVNDFSNNRHRRIAFHVPGTFSTANLQPGQSIPLFTDNLTFRLNQQSGGPVTWPLIGTNVLQVAPGSGNVVSTQHFDAFHLHAEFRTPTDGSSGNSGIYLQGRYEIQIFNSFGVNSPGVNDCGAIWGLTPPATNACLAPGAWQTYEITFYPAQWNHTNKVRNARVTVALNGVLLHHNVEIPNPTQAGVPEINTLGPVLLQDHGTAVQFRNLVITPFNTRPRFDWARRAGGPTTNSVVATSDTLRGISVNNTGSVYVAGSINSDAAFGTNRLVTVGEADAYVAKYNLNGDIQWVTRGGGSLSDEFRDVAATPDGGVVAVGYIGANANFSGTGMANRGGRDIVIIKYDGNGLLQWSHSVGGSGDDQANGVTVEANGDILVTGGFSLTNKFGPNETLVATGNTSRQDIFIAKYRPDGTIVWARSAGGILDDVGNDLVIDNQGGAYVVGKVGSSAVFGPIPVQGAGNQESFITHIDASGAFRWLRNSDTFFSASEADSIARSPDGGLYVSGEFINLNIGGFTNRANGVVDAFLLRTTPSGVVSWVRTMGGAGFDGTGGTAVTTDRQGNAYLAMDYGFQPNTNATTATFNATTVPQRTQIGTDAAVARYGADGDFHWVRDFGGNGSDQPAAIGSDPAGNVFVGGNFFGTAQFGPELLNGPTSYDVFVARLQSTQTQLPVSQWRFDDMMPPVVRDSTGGFDGQLSSTGAVLVAGGFSTNAVSLSRTTNGFVSLGNFPITGRDPLTISIAIKVVAGNTNHMVILSRHDTNQGSGFILGLNGMGTNHIPGRVFFTESGRWENALASQVTVNDGRWHSIVVTYEPFGRKALYVDGAFQGFGPGGLIPTLNTPLVAGGITTNGVPVGAYDGLLDELLIYRRILDPNEIGIQGIYPDEEVVPFNLPEFAWVRQILGSTNIQTQAVADDSQGNIYVTGWFEGQAQFGSNNVLFSSGFADMFLAKYSGNGDLLWLKQGGGSQGYDGGMDLAIDSQDNVIVAGNYGRTAFFDGLPLLNGGSGGGPGAGGSGIIFGRGGFVAKYTPAGTIILLKDGWGNINGVDVDSSDSIYIAGTGRLNRIIEGRPLLSFGGNDMWIAKYTPFGTVAWAVNYGSGGNEEINDIRLDQANNIYVAGQFSATMQIGTQTLIVPGTPANARLPFLIKLNSGTGAPIWALNGNGSAFGNIYSVQVDSLNRPNIAGQFFSSLNFSSIRMTNTITSGYRAVFTPDGAPVTGLPYHDDIRGMALNGLTNIYLWGNFNGNESVGTNVFSSAGGEDALLLKVNDAGTNRFSRHIRGIVDDEAAYGDSVAVDPPGNVYITGFSTTTNGSTIQFGQLTSLPTPTPQGWVAKIPSEVQILRPPSDLVATNLDTTFFRVMPGGQFPFTYRWYYTDTNTNTVLIPGANEAILRLTNLALALPGKYHVVVSNPNGFAESPKARLSLALPPVIINQPQNLTVAVNRTAAFNVQVGGIGPFAYQWFFKGNPITNANAATLNLSNISTNDEGIYHVAISNQFGITVSDAAQLSTFPEGVLPEMITQPVGTNKPVNSFVSFNVTAGGMAPLFYQWYHNGNPLSGRTQPFLNLFGLQLTNSGNYFVIITNSVGSVTSSIAPLQVFVPTAPIITNQPQSRVVQVGSSPSMSVGVMGTPVLRYQWLRNGAAIPGATNPVLNFPNIQLSAVGEYKAQIFNDAGFTNSTAATLTVHQPPFFINQPQTVTISNGHPTTLISVIGGVPAPSIQWFRNGVALQDGTEYLGVRNQTLSILSAGIEDIGTYFVTATNAAGAITSAPASLILDFPVQILAHPASANRPATSNHTFSISVTGAPPVTIQWRFRGVPIPNANTNQLTITNLNRTHTGLYDAVVQNGGGSLTSSNALLRVLVPQRISAPQVNSNRFSFVFGESDGSSLVQTNLPPFEVQLTTNFGSWHRLTNSAIFTNGMLYFEDILPPALRNRYYRVIEP